MNDQDQYRRMVLTTTQFEATLNLRNGRGLLSLPNRKSYNTIFGQQQSPMRTNAERKIAVDNPIPKPKYFIDETEKWWK